MLREIAEPSRKMAERLAPELDSGKLLVLSAGASYTLGHMMAYDMFGEFLKEYCRLHSYAASSGTARSKLFGPGNRPCCS